MLSSILLVIFSFKSCSDLISKNIKDSSVALLTQVQVFDSAHLWNDPLFWSVAQGIFTERRYSSNLSYSFSESQTKSMVYLSDSCGLIDWISRKSPIQQEWYLPYVPENILCAHWDKLRTGIGRTPSNWNGCVVAQHANELSKAAQVNGFTNNEDLMMKIHDTAFLNKKLLKIQNILNANEIRSESKDELKYLTQTIRRFGDSTKYGQALSYIWNSQVKWIHGNCSISLATFFLSDIVPHNYEASKSLDSLIRIVGSLDPSNQDQILVKQIDANISKIFEIRFGIQELAKHSSISGSCKNN